MSNGDHRRSHSASFFKVTGGTEEDINKRPKRLREEDNATPAILVDVPSTATLTEESLGVNNDLLLIEKHHVSNNKTQLFERQTGGKKEFFTRCVAEVLFPKGLEVTLEPKIGNHDQELLDN